MPAKDTIVSFWDGFPNKGQYLGCGVCIAPDTVLTAYHVLVPKDAAGKPHPVPHEQLRVGRVPIGDGGLPVKAIHHHSQRDISLVKLNDQHGKLNAELAMDAELAIQYKVDVLGIDNSASGNHSLKMFSTVLSSKSVELNAEGWKFHSEPSHGMSGGGVFVAESKRLVGITQARTPSQNAGIMIPLVAIWDFLNTHLPSACTAVPTASDAEWQQFDEILAEDQAYLQQIEADIEADLRHSAVFCENITSRCNLGSSQPDGIKQYMLSECRSGNFTKLLSRLRSASLDAANDIGSDNHISVKGLLDVAHDVVSKLVVFNIEAEAIRRHKLDYLTSGGGVRGLPNMSNLLAPAFAARSLNATAGYHFKHSGSRELEGNVSVILDSGFSRNGGSNDVVNRIICKIFAKVMDKELSGDMSNEYFKTAQLKRLNAMLKVRKEHEDIRTRRRYFLVISDDVIDTYKDILDEIRELVPDFLFFHITSDYIEGIFTIDDVDMEAALIDYFTALEKLRPHEQ